VADLIHVASRQVPPAGFKYLVTEMVGWAWDAAALAACLPHRLTGRGTLAIATANSIGTTR
jgi:hypothetical protein